jgi:transcriptional regulator with PAS, ATPase and Fis domain
LLTAVAKIAAERIENAQLIDRLKDENARLHEELDIRDDLVAGGPAIAELKKQIANIAGINSTVLIQGESGTGKELVARAIHRNSKRPDGPFVAVNCAALPEHLLESELFGYEKGAFTGATAQKKGKFEQADGGTIFLDEIGDLPLALQPKLLRALQEREVDRVGGTRSVRVDVRIVAATNRDLASAVAKNEFRQDLYYRLNVVSIRTPPLRDRPEDILGLAQHFLSKYSREMGRVKRGLSPAAESMLKEYDWPGNVRELQNVIERAVAVGATDMVLPEDLAPEVTENSSNPSEYVQAPSQTRRELLRRAMIQAGGDYIEAAKILGIHPNSVLRALKRSGLEHLKKKRGKDAGETI